MKGTRMNAGKTALRTVVGLAVAALAMSGCSSSPSTGSSGPGGGTFKFGLVTSSVGPFAPNYKSMVDGAQYATKVINDGGGVNGAKVDLVTVDTQNNPSNGVTMLPKLATSDQVFAIVGPVDSAGCDIACTAANKLKVPLISPGAGRPGVLVNARPYAFTLVQPDAANSTPVLEQIVKKNNVRTAAIISDDATAVTKAQRDLFDNVFAQTNVQVAKHVTFSSGDASFASQVTSIAQSKPDVLALAAGPADAGRIAREVRSQGLSTTLVGTGSLQSGGAAYYAAGGPATEGTLSAAQYDPTNPTQPAKDLLAKAQTATGQAEISLNFAYAYDAVNMLVQIIKSKGVKPGDSPDKARTQITDGLNALKDYDGMAGKTTFTDDGTAIRPQLLAVLKNGVFVIDHTSN